MKTFLAILLVVLCYSTHMYTTTWLYKMRVESDLFSFITTYIYNFYMLLFIFIADWIIYYLKVENNKYSDYIKLINKKIDRIKPYIL